MSGKSVLNVIEHYINLYNENKDCYEVEARYGDKTDKFQPNLSALSYDFFLKYFKQKTVPEEKYEFIVMHKTEPEPFKVIQEMESFNFPWKNGKVVKNTFLKKQTQEKIDLVYYSDIRVSLSKEEPYNPKSQDFKTPVQYMKLRGRNTFLFDKIKVDLSYYKEGRTFEEVEASMIKFELEIEYVHTTPEIYFELVKEFDMMIYHSLFDINQEYLDKIPKNLQRDALCKYQSVLAQKELKMAGLKPVTYSHNKLVLNEEYAITPKLDGQRVQVLLYNKSIFIINEQMNIAKLKVDITTDKVYVLEGELYKGDVFLYEILVHEGVDLRDKTAFTLIERMGMIKNICELFLMDSIFFIKEYYFIDAESNTPLIQKAQEIYTNTADVKIDGVMFVPIDRPLYKKQNEFSCLKWKPDHLNTLDFLIKKKEVTPEYEIWKLYFATKQGLKPFYLPTCKIQAEFAQNFMDNTICEFAYNPKLNMMVPIKMRLDKKTPNFETTVNDIWNIIQSPPELQLPPPMETNKMDFSIINKWLHWVRRNVYASFFKKANNVLFMGDIEGDIYKWVDFDIRSGEVLVKNSQAVQDKIDNLLDKPMNKSFSYKAFDINEYIHNENNMSCACFFIDFSNKDILLNKATKVPKIVFITDLELEKERQLQAFTLKKKFSVESYYQEWTTKGFSMTEKEKRVCMKYNVYVFVK